MSFPIDQPEKGMSEVRVVDETILATIEGCADELQLVSYSSLSNVSTEVVVKAYKMVMLAYGKCGDALTKRYNEVSPPAFPFKEHKSLDINLPTMEEQEHDFANALSDLSTNKE